MNYFSYTKPSNYESIIVKILLENKVSFEREKSFYNLASGKFRFDFYIKKFNCCIECDGEQHFYQIKHFQKTRRDFLKQQEHDRIKNSYCLANNIKLYRIPYWEINNIKTISDIFQLKFLVKNRWHNDMLKVPKK